MTHINFDRVAMVYDQTREVPKEIINLLIEKINKVLFETFGSPPYQILSLGIGSGRVEKYLSSKDNHLFGIDISELMLRELKKKQKTESIATAQADVYNLPFRGNFHLTVAIHLVHLLDNLERFLNETLKASKLIIIGDVYTDAYQSLIYSDFIEILSKIGWEKQDSAPVDGFITREMSRLGFLREDIERTETTSQTHYSIYDSIKKKYFSWLWDVPDAIYNEALSQLETRIQKKNINLNESYQTTASIELKIFKKRDI